MDQHQTSENRPGRSLDSCLIQLRACLRTAALFMLAVAAAKPAMSANIEPGDKLPLVLASNSETRHPQNARVLQYPVVHGELVRNGKFSSGLDGWQPGRQSDAKIRYVKELPVLTLNGSLVQKVAPNILVPGRAYRLSLTARNPSDGYWNAAVRFREPRSGNTFRSYYLNLIGSKASAKHVDFTAPAYTAMAEIELTGTDSAIFENISLEMREPQTQTQEIKDWSASYVPAEYQLLFNDEFSGDELDSRKWFTRYISGGETLDRLNDEKQRYRDNWNHVVKDGVLNLVARRKPLGDKDGIDYESGVIRSDWIFRYGFLEARVRMPKGRGVWPAFWLLSDVGDTGRINWPPEIDIFEYAFNEIDDRANQIHMAANTPKDTKPQWIYIAPGFKPQTSDWVASEDFNKGWHTIAVEWKPDLLNFFVDGQKVAGRTYQWTYTDGTIAAPAHVLLNLAIGGSWAGRHGIDTTAFPQALEIDWVRVYQKPPIY